MSTGAGDDVQLPNVSTLHEPRVDYDVGLGQEGGDMVDGRGPDDRARRLLEIQGKCATLLQEGSHGC